MHRPRRKITTVHALSEANRLEVQPAENAPFAHQPVPPSRGRAGGTLREAALLERVESPHTGHRSLKHAAHTTRNRDLTYWIVRIVTL